MTELRRGRIFDQHFKAKGRTGDIFLTPTKPAVEPPKKRFETVYTTPRVDADIQRGFDRSLSRGFLPDPVIRARRRRAIHTQRTHMKLGTRLGLTAIIGIPLTVLSANMLISDRHPERFTTRPPIEAGPQVTPNTTP